LGENDLVGELSLLAPVQRTADVTAAENIVVFRIEREFFLELVYEEPAIVSGLLKVLVSRIIDQNKKITSSGANA
jgi:CRP-like cAMP-binding protein